MLSRPLHQIVIVSLLCTLTGCQRAPVNVVDNNATASTGAMLLKTTRSDNPWWQAARTTLQERIDIKPRNQHARNIILFIGDGMGPSTVTAARIFDGQSRGASGEENILSFERFPYTGLVKTYNVDSQVPDSAGTASAINTGVKTVISAINVWHDRPFDCYGVSNDFPLTLAQRAETAGLSTGIVTTARVTHATPAAVYAHSPDRNWEDDSVISEQGQQSGCHDIARQLIEFDYGDGIDVILGGGRTNFLPAIQNGRRLDNRDLTTEWLKREVPAMYVNSASELRAIHQNNEKAVLGLFTDSHMAYETDRNNQQEPSLAEMTHFAIQQLANNDNGYFLMVEGARIDHAHHQVNAHRALRDAQAFAAAVETAVDHVNLDETLILVTADHSHVFTMSGYPVRGNPITGLVRQLGPDRKPKPTYELADDGKPFTTLGYHNGINPRLPDDPSITQAQALDPDYNQQSAMSMEFETHGGEDVAIYAIGPQAHLVGGVLEQNVIFHIMTYALGWQAETHP